MQHLVWHVMVLVNQYRGVDGLGWVVSLKMREEQLAKS